MAGTSEALVDLALGEGAITEADARRLRAHIGKTGAGAAVVERLMVQHHRVPPERARSLRQRTEGPPAPAAPAPSPPAPVAAPGPVEEEAVLLLYPPGEDAAPTAAQRAAVEALGLPAELLGDPLPRVERAGARPELERLAAGLRAAGLDARAAPRPEIAAPRVVERARLMGSILTLRCADGELDVDVGKPALLVQARADERAGNTGVVHLYAGGDRTPFEVTGKTELPAFRTRQDPLRAFVDSLAAARGVTACDLLAVHAEPVTRARPAIEPASLPWDVAASSQAVVLSWLLHDAWLDGIGVDPALLAHAVRRKDVRATARQGLLADEPARRTPSGRVPAPVEAPPAARAEPALAPGVSLQHVLRGGSVGPAAPGPQRGPAPAAQGGAGAVLGQVLDRVKGLGTMRLMGIAAVLVLAFLVHVLLSVGGGIEWHLTEEVGRTLARKRKVQRVVVLKDDNNPECRSFLVAVLDSSEVRAICDQFVWQHDREDPQKGGYDRSPDFARLSGGNGKLPFIFVYDESARCIGGIRGAAGMTPQAFVAFLEKVKRGEVQEEEE